MNGADQKARTNFSKWILRAILIAPFIIAFVNASDLILYLADGDDYPIGW